MTPSRVGAFRRSEAPQQGVDVARRDECAVQSAVRVLVGPVEEDTRPVVPLAEETCVALEPVLGAELDVGARHALLLLLLLLLLRLLRLRLAVAIPSLHLLDECQ